MTRAVVANKSLADEIHVAIEIVFEVVDLEIGIELDVEL